MIYACYFNDINRKSLYGFHKMYFGMEIDFINFIELWRETTSFPSLTSNKCEMNGYKCCEPVRICECHYYWKALINKNNKYQIQLSIDHGLNRKQCEYICVLGVTHAEHIHDNIVYFQFAMYFVKSSKPRNGTKWNCMKLSNEKWRKMFYIHLQWKWTAYDERGCAR